MSGIFLGVLGLIAAGGLFISWLSSGPEPASVFSRRIIKYPGLFFLSVLTIFAIYAFVHSMLLFNSNKIRVFSFQDRVDFERMAAQSPELFPKYKYFYEYGIPRYKKFTYYPSSGEYCLVAVNRLVFPPVTFSGMPQFSRFMNKLICTELFGGEFGVLFSDGDAVTIAKYLIATLHSPIMGYYTTLVVAYLTFFVLWLVSKLKTLGRLRHFSKYGLVDISCAAVLMAVASLFIRYLSEHLLQIL